MCIRQFIDKNPSQKFSLQSPRLLKIFMCAALIQMCLTGALVTAQENQEISGEDLEIIAMMDLLDNLDILQEDLGLIEDLDQIGEDDEY